MATRTTRKSTRGRGRGRAKTRKELILEEIEAKGQTVDEILHENRDELVDDEDDDDEDDEEIALSGPEYIKEVQRVEDEMVIDDLIQGIPKNQGYYLLLYRELRPNEYELKERIDHYHHWTDMEWEIMSLVRRNSESNPRKWGSGRYRIQIKREKGLRGPKYDPLDFIIDAGDGMEPDSKKEGTPNVMESVEAQMAQLSNMMNAVKGFMPAQVNPSDIQNNMANAFQQGMQMKVTDANNSKSESGQMMVMMVGMMGEMMKIMRPTHDVTPTDPTKMLGETIGMLKNMGVLNPPTHKGGIVESLTELKAIGIEPFKQNDPMDQFKQMRSLAGLLTDFMGAGNQERPGIAEKLVDTLIPALPDILGNLRGMSDNYTALQTGTQRIPTPQTIPGPSQPGPLSQDPRIHEREPFQPGRPEPSVSINGADVQEPIMGGIAGGARREESAQWSAGVPNPQWPSPPSQEPQAGESAMLVQMFFNRLLTAIKTQDENFMPELTTTIQNTQGGNELLQGLIYGSTDYQALMTLLLQWGGLEFQKPEHRDAIEFYAKGYIVWIQNQAKIQQTQLNPTPPQYPIPTAPNQATNGQSASIVLGVCALCKAEYEYDNIEHFNSDTAQCEEKDAASGAQCGGSILAVIP